MAEDLENCVLCKELTAVRRDMPVEIRQFYIEGVGQLCPECYNGVYGHSREKLSHTLIQLDDVGIGYH